MNVVVGPNGSGKSCDYSTLIKLSDGSELPIGRLVEEQIDLSNDIKKLDDGIYVNGDDSIEIISLGIIFSTGGKCCKYSVISCLFIPNSLIFSSESTVIGFLFTIVLRLVNN
jgi:hypothetical protein